MDWKTRLALHKLMKNINEYNTLRVRERGGTDVICILIKECNIYPILYCLINMVFISNLPAPKYSCTIELMCMTELKKAAFTMLCFAHCCL